MDALPKAKAKGKAKKAKAKAKATPPKKKAKAKAAPKSAPEIDYASLARSLPGTAVHDELPYGRKSYTVVAHKKCCCQILLARRAFYVVKPVLPPSLKDSGYTLNAQGDLQIAWSDNIPAAWDTVMSVCTFTDLQK